MTRLRSVLGSAAFILFGGPTIVAGLVPWLLTRWEADDPAPALQILGVAIVVLGAALVLETTARFALQGGGTPAPFAAPQRFVARGIVGQALLLGREVLLLWAAAAALLFHLFVVFHEEPGLGRQFGSEYEDYRARVGRWLPRLSPSRTPPRR